MTVVTNDQILEFLKFKMADGHHVGWELGYRKQIVRRRHKYYTVTLKYRLRVTQYHWKWNHWIDHTRLTISGVT